MLLIICRIRLFDCLVQVNTVDFAINFDVQLIGLLEVRFLAVEHLDKDPTCQVGIIPRFVQKL